MHKNGTDLIFIPEFYKVKKKNRKEKEPNQKLQFVSPSLSKSFFFLCGFMQAKPLDST